MENKKIEFIKWCCQYADGFDIDLYCGKDIISCLEGDWVFYLSNLDKMWSGVYYPLLLQRAIEGINKANKIYWIRQDNNRIVAYYHEPLRWGKEFSFYYIDYDTADIAKEEILMWIMEQSR